MFPSHPHGNDADNAWRMANDMMPTIPRPASGGVDSFTEHERSFAREVLGLEDGDTEEQLDERVRQAAKELGINCDAPQTQPFRPLPAQHSFSPEPLRRSESIDSRTSHSTGFTSNFSDLSRDVPRSTSSRDRSRQNFSFRDYDTFIVRGLPSSGASLSFSRPTTPSHSAFSLPLMSPEASPKKTFGGLRRLSILKLSRNTSSSSLSTACPHCPPDPVSQRRAMHKLPCGHRLCTQALRSTITSAMESKTSSAPSCCGQPIPGTLLEVVMTSEEQNALLDRIEQWDEAGPVPPSDSPPLHSRPDVLSPLSRTTSGESKVDSILPPSLRANLTSTLPTHPLFAQLVTTHSTLQMRLQTWSEALRAALSSQHETLRNQLKISLENALDDLIDRHASALADAEDKQVKAEADLLDAQAQERRDQATALRHMEAYCAGTYGDGSPHFRVVTEGDRAELEKARKVRDSLQAKQNSAVNVLRGEQGRRIRLRAQRHEAEVQSLRRCQRGEELELERSCSREMARVEEWLGEKRRRMVWRKEVEMAGLERRIEEEGCERQCCAGAAREEKEDRSGGSGVDMMDASTRRYE